MLACSSYVVFIGVNVAVTVTVIIVKANTVAS